MTPKEILEKWDTAVFLWRQSDRACVAAEYTDAGRDALREASVMAAASFVAAAGGYRTGFDGPAAIALGWA